MKRSFKLVLLLIISLSGLFNSLNAQKKQEVRILETNYGLYSIVSESVKSEGSPSGRFSEISNYSLRKKTDTIDTVLGETFGVEYTVLSKKKKPVLIRKVWTLPTPMVDQNGKLYKEIARETEINVNDNTITTYEFEEEFEMVLGKWTLRMYQEEKLLYERDFFIIKR